MKRCRWLFMFVLPSLLLVGGGGMWLRQAKRQYALNCQLITALIHNDSRQALILVNAGADPNTRYNSPTRPSLTLLLNQMLHRQSSPDASPTAFLIACGVPYRNDPIPEIEYPDDPALVKTMLTHGANLPTQAENGWTALLGATYTNHVQVAKLLLEQGADANGVPEADLTPLMWAALNGSNELVGRLLTHGAKVNIQDGGGQTALHYAFKPKYNYDTMRLLLTHGANPNVIDMNGVTPLMLARETGRSDIMALFLNGRK